jgi:ABC-type lipoprotein export system ATPase subunit
MITVKGIAFSYNDTNQFFFPDFSCENAKTLLITGNSGAGKSTLLHLLAGLMPPKNGSIYINNTNICSLKKSALDKFRGKNIGIIFQKYQFISSLNVLENIEFISWLSCNNKQTKKAKQILNTLGLEEHVHKKCTELSAGQLQRFSVARAIINEPELLLADEPTSNLDDINCAIVSDLLSETAKTLNASLIIVTHDNRLKQKYADYIELK